MDGRAITTTSDMILTIAIAMRHADLGLIEQARQALDGWSMDDREYMALDHLIEQAASSITGAEL